MKTILFLCCYCFVFSAFAQHNNVELLIEDALGQKDTIYFGALTDYSSNGPTLGMDANWGEHNIWNQAFNNLDARIIQRDSMNHHCIRQSHSSSPAAPNLYYPSNFDSKKDYRPFGNTFESMENNFEIFIHANNYPITIRLNNVHLLGGFITSLQLLNNQCNAIETEYLASHTVNVDTLFVITDPTLNTLVGRMEMIVPTNKVEKEPQTLFVFPNPATKRITVNTSTIMEGSMTIFNALGQDCLRQLVQNESTIDLDVQHLAKGSYWLKYWDEKEGKAVVQQFIKE